MPSISVPLGELRDRYDAVVIGSGYGGGVAALRLAEKRALRAGTVTQAHIAVFERGREWLPGGFPGTTASAFAELQLDTGRNRYGRQTGLFDLRADDDMMVLVGCGLGGTSLINANVMIEPVSAVFDRGWPAALAGTVGHAVLKDHFAQVKSVLRAVPLPLDILPMKVQRMGDAGTDATPAKRPDIAVSFDTAMSPFSGVGHNRCTLCGNCVTGCNHGAKHTVDRNYLAAAVRRGVDIFCELETRTIEWVGGEWHLHVRLTDPAWGTFKAGEFVVRAGTVVLAAGALGSTEILLRSRDRHALPLSQKLGSRFSGNGDVIAFSYDGREAANAFGYGARLPVHPTVGPSITSMLDERMKSGLMIQDAAIPGALATVMRFAARGIAWRTPLPQAEAGDYRLLRVWHELSSLLRGAGHGVLSRTQSFLVMSRDDANGRLVLSPDTGRLRIQWPGVGSGDLFVEINVRLRQLAEKLKGRFVANPAWNTRGMRRLISVHPLGGCVMADSPNDGVVNDRGQVYTGTGNGTHPGLYVCDGSIVPVALGANPALTIAALAERVMEHASIPQLESKTTPTRTPKAKRRAEVRTDLSESNEPGIVYGERLTGTVTWGRETSPIELMLHISADSFERLLAAPGHEARVIGVAHTPKLRDNRSWTIIDGRLNVHVSDPRHPDTRLMLYRLELTGDGGGRVRLRGHKTINRASCRKNLWRAISGFAFVLHAPAARLGTPGDSSARLHEVGPGHEEFGAACDWVDVSTRQRAPRACESYDAIACATGAVGNRFADALAMLRSVRIIKQTQRIPRLTAMARYAWFFSRPVLAARFSTLERTDRGDPFCREPLDVPTPICPYDDSASPGTGPRFKLTKYEAIESGKVCTPLILAPGFGMSTDAFHSKGHGDSIVEFFRKKGHDVWLLDYRGSDKLDISLTQFSLDDLVEDFADAIAHVYEHSHRRGVRVLSHCVASLVTSMLLLDAKHGPRVAPYLESVILSQSLAFMDQPFVNRLKAWLRLPEMLRLLRFNPVLTSDDDLRASWRSRLFDRLLRFYPTQEHCSSSVCRRTIFMYGEVIRHEHISSETHGRIYDFFDRANLTSFAHIAHMIRAGRIVNRYGENVYLTPENGRAITTPLTFFQGERNRLFRPDGGKATYDWFQAHRHPTRSAELFTYLEMPGYGHLDNFIGEHAACDVFPRFDEAFTRMATLATPPA